MTKYHITKYAISICIVEASDKRKAKNIAVQMTDDEFEREEQADFLCAEAV